MSSNTNQAESTIEKNPTEIPKPKLEGEALQEAIKKQVEFYFSEENLKKDTYLLSLMDENHYVPLAIIANFSKMKSLTEDLNLIVESLKTSSIVKISDDNSKVCPREGERRTLLLYNLHPDTKVEDIENLIKPNYTIQEVVQDINNSFFVSFPSEEIATSAIYFLREQKLHDQNIRVRFKPESVVRSLYVTDAINYVPYGNRMPWNPPMWDANNEYRNFENKDQRGKGNFRNKRKDNNRKGNRKKNNRNENNKKTNTTLQLGPSHFPPLPSAKNSTHPTESFTKYSASEIMENIEKLDDIPKPKISENAPVLSEPNQTLESLKNLNDTEIQNSDYKPKAKKSNKSKQKNSNQQDKGQKNAKNSNESSTQKESSQPVEFNPESTPKN